jgi:hypothetical protein
MNKSKTWYEQTDDEEKQQIKQLIESSEFNLITLQIWPLLEKFNLLSDNFV